MSYTNPVPGKVERVDQGVDIAPPPGTPVRAITNETLVGIIPNWFKGQPFYWFKQAGSNVYNYVAEQFKSNLRIGQSVQAGQQIGTVAPSGTGLELGWATASGQTLARATTGYTEGQATPAGQSYRQAVIQGGGSAGNPTTDLAQLWIDAGGNPHVANTMAAIALAESGGKVDATGKNTNGTTDYGLWQINSSHTQFDPQRLTSDPLYNAQAAVAVFKTQGLTAWTTYVSGAYRNFLSGAANAQYTPGPGYGGTRPGGQAPGDTGATSEQYLQEYVSLRDTPRTAPPGTKNPFQWWAASFTDNWSRIGQ
jgi:hypothetical protein